MRAHRFRRRVAYFAQGHPQPYRAVAVRLSDEAKASRELPEPCRRGWPTGGHAVLAGSIAGSSRNVEALVTANSAARPDCRPAVLQNAGPNIWRVAALHDL
jgi:hypothetical protein